MSSPHSSIEELWELIRGIKLEISAQKFATRERARQVELDMVNQHNTAAIEFDFDKFQEETYELERILHFVAAGSPQGHICQLDKPALCTNVLQESHPPTRRELIELLMPKVFLHHRRQLELKCEIALKARQVYPPTELPELMSDVVPDGKLALILNDITAPKSLTDSELSAIEPLQDSFQPIALRRLAFAMDEYSRNVQDLVTETESSSTSTRYIEKMQFAQDMFNILLKDIRESVGATTAQGTSGGQAVTDEGHEDDGQKEEGGEHDEAKDEGHEDSKLEYEDICNVYEDTEEEDDDEV